MKLYFLILFCLFAGSALADEALSSTNINTTNEHVAPLNDDDFELKAGSQLLKPTEAANNMLKIFSSDPYQDMLLPVKALHTIQDIEYDLLSNKEITRADYNKLRFSLLLVHLKVLSVFDKYKHYISDNSPREMISMNGVLPPKGAVEGFDGVYPFPVEPDSIKDNKLREEYIKRIEKNTKLINESNFRAALEKLKMALSADDENGKYNVMADSVEFIKEYYHNSADDLKELKNTINEIFHNSDREKQFYQVIDEMENK